MAENRAVLRFDVLVVAVVLTIQVPNLLNGVADTLPQIPPTEALGERPLHTRPFMLEFEGIAKLHHLMNLLIENSMSRTTVWAWQTPAVLRVRFLESLIAAAAEGARMTTAHLNLGNGNPRERGTRVIVAQVRCS